MLTEGAQRGASAPLSHEQSKGLREVPNTQQVPGEPFRRWYSNGHIDLVVWLDNYRIIGFQLAVPSDDGQTAITWREDKGLSVANIDDGEQRPQRPKMTPILVSRHGFDATAALTLFKDASDGLPPGLAAIVEREISKADKEKKGKQ